MANTTIKPLTPDQLKAKFEREGRTFSDWAKENGYTPSEVYRVVNGLTKAKYGKVYEIAVKLGLKIKGKPQSQMPHPSQPSAKGQDEQDFGINNMRTTASIKTTNDKSSNAASDETFDWLMRAEICIRNLSTRSFPEFAKVCNAVDALNKPLHEITVHELCKLIEDKCHE